MSPSRQAEMQSTVAATLSSPETRQRVYRALCELASLDREGWVEVAADPKGSSLLRHDAGVDEKELPISRPPKQGTIKRDLAAWLADPDRSESQADSLAKRLGLEDSLHLLSLVELLDRPALPLSGGSEEPGVPDISDQTWAPILKPHLARISAAASAVGAVILATADGNFPIATAWRLTKDVVVTNRHVVSDFAEKSAAGTLEFRTVLQHGRHLQSVLFSDAANLALPYSGYPVRAVIPVESEYDLAFLRIEDRGDQPAPLVQLAESLASSISGSVAVTIGFPCYDPDAIMREQLAVPAEKVASYRRMLKKYFADKTGLKMALPGKVTGLQKLPSSATILLHNCSTLAGNSGSVVLDPLTGLAVGLHYGGVVLQTNYAVPSPTVLQLARKSNVLR